MTERNANIETFGVGWDGDGVLYDSRLAQVYAHNALRGVEGLPVLESKEVYRRMGGLAHDSFVDFGANADRTELLRRFHEYYQIALDNNLVTARPGAREAVLRLQDAGLKQGMLTHGARFVVPCLEIAGIDPAVFGNALVDSDVLKREGLRGKPYAEGFVYMTQRMGVLPHNAAFVGDMPNDVHTAQGYGIEDDAERVVVRAGLSVALTGGFAVKSALEAVHPDAILSGPGAVPETVFQKLIAPRSKGGYL